MKQKYRSTAGYLSIAVKLRAFRSLRRRVEVLRCLPKVVVERCELSG